MACLHPAHGRIPLAGMVSSASSAVITTNAVPAAQSARSRKPVVDWVRGWTGGQVQGWLRATGLARLAPAFADITGKVRRRWSQTRLTVSHDFAWGQLCGPFASGERTQLER